MTNGRVRILSKQGCPVGEVKLSIDGKCHRILREKPEYNFNIRDKRTGEIKTVALGSGKNVLSHVLTDTKWMTKEGDVVLTVEKVLWDSDRDKPLEGYYIYRDKDYKRMGVVDGP